MLQAQSIPLLFFAAALAIAAGFAWRQRDWRVIAFAGVLLIIELPEFDDMLGAVVGWRGTEHADAIGPIGAVLPWGREDAERLVAGGAALLSVLLLIWVMRQWSMTGRALKENEKRFRNFAEAGSDWLWEMDADLRFTYMSANVRDVVGVDPEWHYGKTRRDLLGPGYDRTVWDAHLATLEARKPFRNFIYERHAEGIDRRWLRSSGRPYFADDGTFLGYRGVAADATDDMRMQRKVAEMEERFRFAIASIDQGFAMFDQDDRLVIWNDRFVTINSDIADLIAAGATYSGLAAAMAARRRLGAGWYEGAIAAHGTGDADVVRRLPDGQWIRVHDRRTADGGSVMIWTDVTELKQAGQRASASLAELQMITDNVPVVISHFDADERLRFTNRPAERWYGQPRAELIGAALKDLLPAGTYRTLRPHIAAALAGRTPHFEATLTYPDGVRRDVEVTYVPERDAGGAVCGAFGVALDVTDQRRLRHERQRSETKLANLVAGSLQGIWVYGNELFANAMAARMFGYDDVDDLQAIGGVDALIAPDDLPRLRGYRAARLNGDAAPSVYEFEGRTKTGDSVWIVAMSRPVDWDGQQAVLTSAIDMTERRRAAGDLQRVELRAFDGGTA